MLSENTQHLVREAVGIFDNAQSLQAAADELMSSGFDRACLSLVAGHQAVEEKLGHMYEKVDNLEDDPAVPRKAFAAIESLGDAEGAIIGCTVKPSLSRHRRASSSKSCGQSSKNLTPPWSPTSPRSPRGSFGKKCMARKAMPMKSTNCRGSVEDLAQSADKCSPSGEAIFG